MKLLKRFLLLQVVISIMLTATASAFDFPEPDWAELFYEREAMVTESEFELYVEGDPANAPYYGARLEPRSGAYLGIACDGILEELKPYGSYLTYIESYYQNDLYNPSKGMIQEDDVVSMIGFNVTDLNVDYNALRVILDKLNAYNKPMIIRFAAEMNCSNLGDEPQQYVDAFRNVANMIHEYPNFAVVWSPNDLGALNRPFEYFYPGDEYVDWVGVSCYMPKYFTNEVNTSHIDSVYFMTGDYAWATNKIKPVVEFMQKNNINKPLMLSEGGVARYNSFGDDYTGWNEPRLRNMLWYLIMKYPQIKMINYFNVNFNNHGEHYYFSDYPESVKIFSEAINNGAYLRTAYDTPEFVFSPANNGETLTAKDGAVNLYTYAYFDKMPNLSVTYTIDDTWYHSVNEIPYTCRMSVNDIADGEHTLTISTSGASKSYKMYKSGQYVRFGSPLDPSLIATTPEENPPVETPPAEIPPEEAPPVEDFGVSVILNGNYLSFDQPPIIVDGRTLVPFRAIFEALGANVEWIGEEQKVIVQKDDTTISLYIGSYLMYVNGIETPLDVPARIVNGRTLVPLRAISEPLNCQVSWQQDTRTVGIETE